MNQIVRDKVVLGIDPGTNLMGYGVLHIINSKPNVLTLGVIDLRKYANHYLKLDILQLTKEIKNIIKFIV